jgi:hypothetical protein
MDLKSLRAVLGGEITGRQLNCPGPGHSRRDRSLSVRISADAPDGFLCFSHAGDDWRDCRDYVRQQLGMPQWEPGDDRDRCVRRHLENFDILAVDREAEERRELTDEDRQRIKRAVEIWNDATDPRHTLAQKYLNETRMLELPDTLAGSVLRFHPRCPWRDENQGITIGVPALLAAFRSIDNDEITAIHRIAINEDGTKRDRRMLGIVYRTAVKLDHAGETLAIAEGVETAMAAREMGITPCWALGGTGPISKFPVLDGVKTLVIVAEAGKASADATALCKQRWRAASRAVRVITPDAPYSDLNDELMASKVARAVA